MELKINGENAIKGKEYKDFRGDTHILLDWRLPHKPSSTGRVITDKGEFFPGVINGQFVDE